MTASPTTGVSVIVPAYNSAKYLPGAIDSILGQTIGRPEVIVVDDGSTDETPRVAESYGERIRYVRTENGGPSHARNVGIRASKAQYVAFLDADDLWLPDKLEKQLEMMRSDPELGLVFSDAEFFDGAPPFVGSFWKLRGCHDDMTAEASRIRRPFARLMEMNFILPSSALARRDCFDKAGLFDESLRSVEDKDLWLRISMHYAIGCVPRSLVKRRVHGYSADRVEYMKGCIIRVVEKIASAYPDQIEKEGVDTRGILGPLYYSLGRTRFDNSRFVTSREAFAKRLEFGFHAGAALFWFVTLLGPGTIQMLRAWKRRLRGQYETAD